MTKLARSVTLFFGLACGLMPAATLAGQDAKMEALRHYDRGLSLVKQKAYGEAIAEFNQAYELGHDFVVLYDIGQAYLAIEQPVYAVDVFKRYLAAGGKHVPKSRRAAIEAEIAKQEERIATLVIETTQAGAVIRIDGIAMGTTPLSGGIRVNSGVHSCTASAVGYRPWERKLELVGGERRVLDLRFEADAPVTASLPPPAPAPAAATAPLPVTPAPAPAAAAAAPAPAAPKPAPAASTTAAQNLPPKQKSAGTSNTAAYVVGAASAAALVTGGVFGGLAIWKRHQSDKACPNNQCSANAVSLNNDAKTYARICDITLGVGLVGAAVATYLFIRSPKDEAGPQATSAQGPRLTAAVGPGEAGLVLGGSW